MLTQLLSYVVLAALVVAGSAWLAFESRLWWSSRKDWA